MLQAQLGNLLPSPLLVAGVDSHCRPSGELAGLDLAHLRFFFGIVVLDLHLLGGLLLADFLDTGVGHFGAGLGVVVALLLEVEWADELGGMLESVACVGGSEGGGGGELEGGI